MKFFDIMIYSATFYLLFLLCGLFTVYLYVMATDRVVSVAGYVEKHGNKYHVSLQNAYCVK